MPHTVLICEDEPLARETLHGFVAAWPELQLVGEASDGKMALAMIREHAPQIVLLDIQMPEMTGLEVLRRLEQEGIKSPAVVFTTAWDHHAVTAFELNAVDYLLKPFSQERFDVAIRRLLEDGPGSTGAEQVSAGLAMPLSRILVRDRGRIFPLDLAQIEYLKSDTKYTLIASGGRSFLVRVALAELEARLPAERFLRIHRSAIINLDFVVSMKPDEQSQLEIEMHDGTVLTANREASRKLRDWSI